MQSPLVLTIWLQLQQVQVDLIKLQEYDTILYFMCRYSSND